LGWGWGFCWEGGEIYCWRLRGVVLIGLFGQLGID
jgi:hypothetical protein